MTDIVRIAKDTEIIVCDSQKALIVRNAGTPARPELEIAQHIDDDAPAEDMFDSDRAGRRFDGGNAAIAGGARSAMETRDVGRIRSEGFADRVTEALERRYRSGTVRHLIVVAPPAFLGILRQKMSPEVRDLVAREIDKHMTEMPVRALQESLIETLERSD